MVYRVFNVIWMTYFCVLKCNGNHPTVDNVRAINQAPKPICVKELYLGLVNYYGMFSPNFQPFLGNYVHCYLKTYHLNGPESVMKQ